ncbi:MAG: ABC transporter substrate-binding protein [Theionarchaea archaeon]|nr:ABC transporter substrate-binding protein [Theionarchaea archaeon]
MRKLLILIGAVLAVSMASIHIEDEVLLKIGCLDELKTLNIWASPDVWSLHVSRWFYPSLYYRKPVTLEPLPDMCIIPFDELKANSPDGLTYTLHLRDDVKWDDGEPVTAYDFEFTYELITELEFEDYLPNFKDVRYFRALNDHTLEINFRRCTPRFEESIIYTFAVPEKQFKPMLEKARKMKSPTNGFLGMNVSDPLSAGPFVFDQSRKGSYVKLITNPDYYGKGRRITVRGVGDIVEGPFYDGLYLKIYGTIDGALQGIKDGEIDYIWWELEKEYTDELQGYNEITIKRADELGFYCLVPNMTKEPFDDKILRQALVYLVDKEYIARKLLKGYGGIAHSVVMPAAGDWVSRNTNRFGSGLSREERIEIAKELLTAAGYVIPDARYPEDVIRLPDGIRMQPFEILILPEDYDAVQAEAGVLIQNWWRVLGIPVTLNVSLDSTGNSIETQTFDWCILGWHIDESYPVYMRYFFHSDQIISEGKNVMGYKNSHVDMYLGDLVASCDRNDLINAAWKAQEIIIDDVACCPLYYRKTNEAHRNDTFTGWFTQIGGIAGSETPQYCLLYLMPTGSIPPRTPPPTTSPPPTTTPPTTPPIPPTKPPPGPNCYVTVLVAFLVLGNINCYRR